MSNLPTDQEVLDTFRYVASIIKGSHNEADKKALSTAINCILSLKTVKEFENIIEVIPASVLIAWILELGVLRRSKGLDKFIFDDSKFDLTNIVQIKPGEN